MQLIPRPSSESTSMGGCSKKIRTLERRFINQKVIQESLENKDN